MSAEAAAKDNDHSVDAAWPREKELVHRALIVGMEFSKRVLGADSLEDLFFMLTNDFRVVIEFDRSALITHFSGITEVSAATNQPTISKKSSTFKELAEIGESVKAIGKGIFLSEQSQESPSQDDLPSSVMEQIRLYMKMEECRFILIIPLKQGDSILGHIVLEFHGDNVPSKLQIVTALNLAPFLAAALKEKWLLKNRPDFSYPLTCAVQRSWNKKIGRIVVPASVSALAVILLFLVPFSFSVGGECEIVPKDRYIAFAKIDGIVEKINVKEGDKVEKDSILAILDRRELDYDVKTAERRFEILTKEMGLLIRESGQEPAKLGESKLLELKRTAAWEELEYQKWKTKFLEIRSPSAGIIVTKEIDSFVGKKFKAGEPFCEIAVPGDLLAAVYVPEDKISLVAVGQKSAIYLNTEAVTAYAAIVEEIAPVAQNLPRLGNVYRVNTRFEHYPEYLKVGMKGIGKIDASRRSLATAIMQRLTERWNQFSIYF